jgi:hypothetical protein
MHLCARIGVHHETCPPFVKVPVRAAYTITKATIDAQLHDAVEWRIGRYAIVEPGVRGNQVCATARAEHDGDGLGLVAAVVLLPAVHARRGLQIALHESYGLLSPSQLPDVLPGVSCGRSVPHDW